MVEVARRVTRAGEECVLTVATCERGVEVHGTARERAALVECEQRIDQAHLDLDESLVLQPKGEPAEQHHEHQGHHMHRRDLVGKGS